MSSPVLGFPDIQAVLVDILTGVAGVTGAGTETPADFTGVLPFVRVVRVGGPSGRVNDAAGVDVDVFTTTYVAGQDLAELVRQLLVGPPPPSPLLDRVACDVGPRELPWGADGIRRFNAAYTVTSRRHRRWP